MTDITLKNKYTELIDYKFESIGTAGPSKQARMSDSKIKAMINRLKEYFSNKKEVKSLEKQKAVLEDQIANSISEEDTAHYKFVLDKLNLELMNRKEQIEKAYANRPLNIKLKLKDKVEKFFDKFRPDEVKEEVVVNTVATDFMDFAAKNQTKTMQEDNNNSLDFNLKLDVDAEVANNAYALGRKAYEASQAEQVLKNEQLVTPEPTIEIKKPQTVVEEEPVVTNDLETTEVSIEENIELDEATLNTLLENNPELQSVFAEYNKTVEEERQKKIEANRVKEALRQAEEENKLIEQEKAREIELNRQAKVNKEKVEKEIVVKKYVSQLQEKINDSKKASHEYDIETQKSALEITKLNIATSEKNKELRDIKDETAKINLETEKLTGSIKSVVKPRLVPKEDREVAKSSLSSRSDDLIKMLNEFNRNADLDETTIKTR